MPLLRSQEGIVVKVLIRDLPPMDVEADVAFEVYKAVLEAFRHKYAIMGYAWERE